MFALLELLADIEELRRLGLSDEEIDGYLDMFIENYETIFSKAEVV